TSAASREYAWVLCNLCMSKVFLRKSASVGDDVEDLETFGLADADHVERALAGDTYRFPAVGTCGFTLAELDQPEAAVGPEHGNVRVLVVDLRDGEAAALHRLPEITGARNFGRHFRRHRGSSRAAVLLRPRIRARD